MEIVILRNMNNLIMWFAQLLGSMRTDVFGENFLPKISFGKLQNLSALVEFHWFCSRPFYCTPFSWLKFAFKENFFDFKKLLPLQCKLCDVDGLMCLWIMGCDQEREKMQPCQSRRSEQTGHRFRRNSWHPLSFSSHDKLFWTHQASLPSNSGSALWSLARSEFKVWTKLV